MCVYVSDDYITYARIRTKLNVSIM